MQYTFTKENVDQLNSFIRGELAAVETYQQAINKITEPKIIETLESCQRSHRSRAEDMATYVRQLGATPAQSSGVWGSLAQIVEEGAKALGDHAAISALEEGEDHGLADYRRDLPQLTAPVRHYVQHHILPEQRRTHDTMSNLQRQV